MSIGTRTLLARLNLDTFGIWEDKERSLFYILDGEVMSFSYMRWASLGDLSLRELLVDGSSENYAYVDGGKPIVALLREVDTTSIDERYIEIKLF